MEFREVARKLANADLNLDVYTLLAVADVVTNLVNEEVNSSAMANVKSPDALRNLMLTSDVILTSILHQRKITAIKHLRLLFQSAYGSSLSLLEAKNAVEAFDPLSIGDLPPSHLDSSNRCRWMISGEEVTDTNRPGWGLQGYDEPPF